MRPIADPHTVTTRVGVDKLAMPRSKSGRMSSRRAQLLSPRGIRGPPDCRLSPSITVMTSRFTRVCKASWSWLKTGGQGRTDGALTEEEKQELRGILKTSGAVVG
jgi:hypothetical protein